MKYTAFGPDAHVYGAAMLAFVESINYANFSNILASHGLTHIHPTEWYPQQVWLDVFSDIASATGGTLDLISIGMKIADTAAMPPQVQQMPFADIMLGFNDGSYLANNRGKDIGGIETRILGEGHILMIDKTPYPDDFVYGAYYGMARRFLPVDSQLTVEYDEEVPRREHGGEATLVHILWQP